MPLEEHVKFISFREKQILQIDFERCPPAELVERIRFARSIIGRQPLGSVRTLTLVKDARFNAQVSRELKEYTAHNKSFVRCAAVVGLSGLQEIVYNVIIKITGRKIATFDDIESAKHFLVSNGG